MPCAAALHPGRAVDDDQACRRPSTMVRLPMSLLRDLVEAVDDLVQAALVDNLRGSPQASVVSRK